MKKKRFSVEQITTALKQAEAGAPVGDLCRQVGCRWSLPGSPPDVSEHGGDLCRRCLDVCTG